jgi:hypothetical protein
MRVLLLALTAGLAACDYAEPSRAQAVPGKGAAVPAASQALRECGSNAVELLLASSRPTISLGEPAVVLIELRNCSAAAVEVPDDLSLEPERAALQILVSPPGGEPFRYLPPVRSRTRPTATLLKPGERQADVAHVYVGRARPWVLSAPGSYRFTGRLSDGKQTIESQPTEITVRPPSSSVPHDKLASFAALLGRALYLGDGGASGTLAAAVGDVRPSLDYLGPFVQVVEVMAKSEQRYDPKSNTFLLPQCGELAADAARIVRSIADPYFSAVTASRLGRCFPSADRSERVQELIGLVRESHPRLSRHPAIAAILEPRAQSR